VLTVTVSSVCKIFPVLLMFIFRNKGVKVELGIPYELWDKPSAEITNMKTQVMSYQFEMQYIYCLVSSGLHLFAKIF
jgi:hypothetical protein